MKLGLRDKKVFITGSTSGIGLEIAKKFSSYGSIVALNSKNEESLKKAKCFFKDPVEGIQGDMTSEKSASEAISKFIDKFQTLDILICNVGSGKSVPPMTENLSDWEKSISLNLLSATNPISASLKHLSKSKGVITCISSICGDKLIENAPLTYSSAKAALNRYIINASFYLAKQDIRINGISPGNVLFKGSVWEKKLSDNREEVLKIIKNKVPLNKFVHPNDITEAAAFLSSQVSSSITGQVLVVDGGQSNS